MRAARNNIKYHLSYIGWLVRKRDWLAGDSLTYADLAAAAHLSAVDYLGDVPWHEDDTAKAWYARIKSRPSFRALLGETLPGVPPAADVRQPRLLTSAAAAAAFKAKLAEAARAQGFDAIGFARPDSIPRAAARLQEFLAAGAHGDMDWMAETPTAAPTLTSCGPKSAPSSCSASTTVPTAIRSRFCTSAARGSISVYAQGDDYHDVIKPRLKHLGRWLIDQAGGDIKVFVDTAPVMEKPLAQAAGIGWQGKHTNLVSREHGSWLFLGAHLHHARSAARRGRDRPLRQLPRLPRHLPDGGISGALSSRCAALHLLSHHRA